MLDAMTIHFEFGRWLEKVNSAVRKYSCDGERAFQRDFLVWPEKNFNWNKGKDRSTNVENTVFELGGHGDSLFLAFRSKSSHRHDHDVH
ncbi:hypothetical protein Tco_1210942 [Tanacetum coccineum]